MIAIKEKLNEILDVIERKPRFIFSNVYSYAELKSFLMGYLWCLDEYSTLSINVYFSEWLNNKYQKTSLFWSEYVYIILAKEDNEKAIELLLKEFRCFINSLDNGNELKNES